MNSILIPTSIAVAIVVLAGLLIFLALRRRKAPYLSTERAESLGLDVLRRLPPSPLTRVQFLDALQSQALTVEVERYCRDTLSVMLSGDALNVAIQSVLLSSNELKLVYKFSREATALYEAGKATIPLHRETGRLLPWMTDNHGLIIEQAKHASMLGVRLASMWALVVSVAHIISGAEVMKRLDSIDRKVSQLLAGRKVDQDSKLMRIYTQAVSILNQPLTSSAVEQLVDFRYDLYQLRQAWRGDIDNLLKAASLPDHSRWRPTSWYRRGKREREVLKPFVEAADRIRNLRVALMTDVCLAQASGTAQDLIANELPNEYRFWEPLRTDMRSFSSKFRRKKTKREASILSAAVEGYTAVLEGITGRETAQIKAESAVMLLSE